MILLAPRSTLRDSPLHRATQGFYSRNSKLHQLEKLKVKFARAFEPSGIPPWPKTGESRLGWRIQVRLWCMVVALNCSVQGCVGEKRRWLGMVATTYDCESSDRSYATEEVTGVEDTGEERSWAPKIISPLRWFRSID